LCGFPALLNTPGLASGTISRMPPSLRNAFARLGLGSTRDPAPHATGSTPSDVASSEDATIIERATPYTMTSSARLQAVLDAVRYAERRSLPGAFVECGVWRGGSVLAMIMTLQELGAERDVYLYDTFEGMTEPTEHDVSSHGPPALEDWNAARAAGEIPWGQVFGPNAFDESSVRQTVLSTGYPEHRTHLVRGSVEDTIPTQLPGSIALLRLDTDWYESTRHELEHLWELVAPGGIIIIDDYGDWAGARKAVDEFFSGRPDRPLLVRIDASGRIGVKR
jgi:hypothetical protein